MERIDTSRMPRFVLEVDAAEVWLNDIFDAFPDGQRQALSPRDSEVVLSRGWSLSSMAGNSDEASRRRQVLSDLLSAAQEAEILRRPGDIQVDLESGEDGFRFTVSSMLWPGLRLTGYDLFFHDGQVTGLHGFMEFLTLAVNDANAMLRSLLEASTLVLAELSTDPVLLTRLADHDESLVRSLVVDNPAAPDEAKVLRSLRDRDEN